VLIARPLQESAANGIKLPFVRICGRTWLGVALLFLLAPKLLAVGSLRDRILWDPGSLNPWHHLAGFALVIGTFVVTLTAVNRARLEDVQPPIGNLLLLRATCLVHSALLASSGMLLASLSGLLAIGFLAGGHVLGDWRNKVNDRRRRTVLSDDCELSKRVRKLSASSSGGKVHRLHIDGDLRPLAEAGKVILSTRMVSRLSKEEIDAIAARQLSFAGVSGIRAFLWGSVYVLVWCLANDHFVVTLLVCLLIHAICLKAVIEWLCHEADLEAVRRTGDPQALLAAIAKLHNTRSWSIARRLSRIATAAGISREGISGRERTGSGTEIEHYTFPVEEA
jgi:hypothetical protein